MSTKVAMAIIAILALFACLVGGMLYSAGKNDVRAQVSMHQVDVQATVEAERARAAQIRETYAGMAEVIDAEADAHTEKRAADLLAYMVQKSEQRQDEMLYYLMNGQSRQDAEAQGYNIFMLGLVGLPVLAALIAVGIEVWPVLAALIAGKKQQAGQQPFCKADFEQEEFVDIE